MMNIFNDLEISKSDKYHIPRKLKDPSYREALRNHLEKEFKEVIEKFDIPKDIYLDSKIREYELLIDSIPDIQIEISEESNEVTLIIENLKDFLEDRSTVSTKKIIDEFVKDPSEFTNVIKNTLLLSGQDLTNIKKEIIAIQSDIISISQNENLISSQEIASLRKYQFSYISSKSNE